MKVSILLILALMCFSFPRFCQEANQTSIVPPSSQAALQEIAVKIAEKVSKAGCDSSNAYCW
jgi:hypothetical protein